MSYPSLTPTSEESPIPDAPVRSALFTHAWGRLTGADLDGRTGTMSYHENGMLSEITHSNGVTETFGLDINQMQQPASITVSGLSEHPSKLAVGPESAMHAIFEPQHVGEYFEYAPTWYLLAAPRS